MIRPVVAKGKVVSIKKCSAKKERERERERKKERVEERKGLLEVMTTSRSLFMMMISHFCLLFSIGQHYALSLSSPPPSNIRYRAGIKSDEIPISLTLVKELMNPLGISAGNNFLVAVDVSTTSTDNDSQQQQQQQPKRVGWVQIRKLGTTSQRDPNTFDSQPGSFDEELDIDDQMWDEFEQDDTIQVPNGFSSLPWTKEYRAFAKSASDRQKRREQIQLDRERTHKQMQVDIWELASVYVDSAYRRQGIGSELIRRIMNEYTQNGKSPKGVYLLTIDSRFYERLGFEVIQSKTDIPKQMDFEISAGNLITGMIGKDLVCMRGCVDP